MEPNSEDLAVLILTIRPDESVYADGPATYYHLGRLSGDRMKIGIEAPKTTRVTRSNAKVKQEKRKPAA